MLFTRKKEGDNIVFEGEVVEPIEDEVEDEIVEEVSEEIITDDLVDEHPEEILPTNNE